MVSICFQDSMLWVYMVAVMSEASNRVTKSGPRLHSGAVPAAGRQWEEHKLSVPVSILPSLVTLKDATHREELQGFRSDWPGVQPWASEFKNLPQ